MHQLNIMHAEEGRDAADSPALMYGDFFAPPRQTPEERAKAMRDMEKSGKSKPKKGKKEEKKGKKDKKGKGKGKASVEDEDDLDMDGMDEEDEEEEGEEGGRDVMSRVKGDLFDDDDEQEEQGASHMRSFHLPAFRYNVDSN